MVESDSYDRRTWNEIVADAPSIGDLVESGERLVPHFGALVQDFFLALFKMNPVMRKSDDVRHAAVLNRTILEQSSRRRRSRRCDREPRSKRTRRQSPRS